MENELEPHEELEALLNGDPEPDLNAVEETSEKGEPEAVAAETVAETPETEKTQEPEVTEETPEQEAPPASKDDEDARFKAMLAKSQDEVNKRQALEAELTALRQQIAQQQQQQPTPDIYDNPEGYRQSLEQTVQAQINNLKIGMSEEFMRMTVGSEKYDEAVSAFYEEAKADPSMAQAVMASNNPAQAAYQRGKAILFQNEVGDDPEAYKQGLIEQGRKEALAEFEAKQAEAAKQQQAQALPRSIANAGSGSPAADAIPDVSLEALLNSPL